MALILTAKDLESFKRIAVAKAGRKSRFAYLQNMLREFEVDSSVDLTDDMDEAEKLIVQKFVDDYGNVSAEDRKAIRSAFSAFLREVRKMHGDKADAIGGYFADSEGVAHYVVTRTK